MKILQINKYYYQKGGAETVFFNTTALLQEHGHTVIPFSIRHPKNKPSEYSTYFVDYPELSESGIRTKIRYMPAFLYNKKAATQLDLLLSREKPDIAHIHLLFNSLSVSILPVLKKHRIPVVMSVHDYRLICPAYTFTDGKGNLCERCLPSKGYWHCIANKCSKGNLPNSILLALDSYFRKYAISPVDYIHRFIFVSHFAQDKHREAESKFNVKSSLLYNFTHIRKQQEKDKGDYILYLGRISEEKGISTLIRASEGLSIPLKVAGTGPLLEKLQEQRFPHVQFLGFKSGDELADLIQRARYVVVPSEWYENNPLSVIEPMSLGVPVIGSRIGGIPELIQDGRTGFLFETKSVTGLTATLQKAISLSHEDYQVMADNAFAFAQDHFSADAHYARLMDIYNQTLAQTKQ